MSANLIVNLENIRNNYEILRRSLDTATECGAVVKADAYGLGAISVAGVLYRAGCRSFFVSSLEEAASLRASLPMEADVIILNGLLPGTEKDAFNCGAIPVLNSLDQIRRWDLVSRDQQTTLRAVIHVDTGMTRLGLSDAEIMQLQIDKRRLNVFLVMSQLTCADDNYHTSNLLQLTKFCDLAKRLPQAGRSLVNTAGIRLGKEWHLDLARPGAGLYGISMDGHCKSPLRQAVELSAPVLQCRAIDEGAAVGYGSTWRARRKSRIATVAIGYADGWPRNLSNKSFAIFAGRRVPVVGLISMDVMMLDITDVPDCDVGRTDRVLLINDEQTVDQVAKIAHTDPRELLSRLGRRLRRTYV